MVGGDDVVGLGGRIRPMPPGECYTPCKLGMAPATCRGGACSYQCCNLLRIEALIYLFQRVRLIAAGETARRAAEAIGSLLTYLVNRYSLKYCLFSTLQQDTTRSALTRVPLSGGLGSCTSEAPCWPPFCPQPPLPPGRHFGPSHFDSLAHVVNSVASAGRLGTWHAVAPGSCGSSP